MVTEITGNNLEGLSKIIFPAVLQGLSVAAPRKCGVELVLRRLQHDKEFLEMVHTRTNGVVYNLRSKLRTESNPGRRQGAGWLDYK